MPSLLSGIPVQVSVTDPTHFDPELACQFDPNADPACHFDADPDPIFHFDADPDPHHCPVHKVINVRRSLPSTSSAQYRYYILYFQMYPMMEVLGMWCCNLQLSNICRLLQKQIRQIVLGPFWAVFRMRIRLVPSRIQTLPYNFREFFVIVF